MLSVGCMVGLVVYVVTTTVYFTEKDRRIDYMSLACPGLGLTYLNLCQ